MDQKEAELNQAADSLPEDAASDSTSQANGNPAETEAAGIGMQDSEQVNQLEQQIQELENRLLRAHADFENFRKRTRQEKEDLAKFASAKLVTELLPVLDNFQLALGSETTDADSLKKGIEMVYRQLQMALEQEGLKPLEAVGQPFDPNYHEAVMQVEQEGVESGQVVEELRKGYLLKDKVIRASMVKVSV